MRHLLTICRFYTRQINLIAFLLSLVFAFVFALRASPSSIALDLYALFYGGLAGFCVAGLVMVPVFLNLKIFGGGVSAGEKTSALESVLFRRPSKKTPDDQSRDQGGSGGF